MAVPLIPQHHQCRAHESLFDRLLSRDGPYFEIRAVVAPCSVPMRSPLIVANEHVLLAPQDIPVLPGRVHSLSARPGSGSLWDLPGFRFRTPAGIDDDQLAALREEVHRIDRG